jgi:AraC-like DNA-binding protein
MSEIYSIKSISEAHKLLGVEKPTHPLISVCRHTSNMNLNVKDIKVSFDMYIISLKSNLKGSFNYGRNTYDFEEGTLLFMAPGQVMSVTENPIADLKGWTLFIHPDLIQKSELGEKINRYSFFDYHANEALHISDKEKESLTEIAQKIQSELNQNIDKHSQNIILHNLESILKYSERFYDRQFLTRTNHNKDFVSKFEKYLRSYFNSKELILHGMPTVTQCGEALGMSGHYLSDMLKIETGKTAKEHIHIKLIDKAKSKLLNSDISVKSLAYDLGFESPQYFSKLFKTKTNMSPTDFRNLN